ncbi:MAG: GAF domain-containing protein [Rhodospirillaceae bacterium]|nr:GAF domain-containing protein [Rhodospirillaceae bacterium]
MSQPDHHNRPRRRSEMLADIENIASRITDLDPLLDLILDITAEETRSERTSLFLNDERTNELYTRKAIGMGSDEIRIPNDTGLVGHAFQSGEGFIIDDAYADSRFNQEVDKQTGFKTRNILCVPVRTPEGEIIGAAQALNKIEGSFDEDDKACLEAMATRAARSLRQAEFAQRMDPPFLRSIKNFFRFISGDRN